MALSFYYPYDLVKVRMQTVNEVYKYQSCLDACIKIYNEPTINTYKGTLTNFWQRIQGYYRGMFLYGIGYVSFIALEFSLFEGILQQIEQWKEERRQRQFLDSHKNFLALGDTDSSEAIVPVGESEKVIRDHSRIDIALAAFAAGGIGGLLTNSFEYLSVNKQTDPNFKVS